MFWVIFSLKINISTSSMLFILMNKLRGFHGKRDFFQFNYLKKLGGGIQYSNKWNDYRTLKLRGSSFHFFKCNA